MRFFMRLGFVPFVVRVERWRLFRRSVRFQEVEAGVAEQLVDAQDLKALAALGLTSIRP
jgi:hypothetical protein